MKIRLLVVGMSLYNGGAERSLVNFLHLADYKKYDIDLLLFKKEGMFLEQVPEQVNILQIPNSLKYCYNGFCSDRGGERGTGRGRLRPTLARYAGTAAMKLCRGSYHRKRQFRWKYFYRNAIRELEGEYDVAMAYVQGEVSWYVVDRVRAKRKILWMHIDYDRIQSNDRWDEQYFSKCDAVVSVSDRCVEILKRHFPQIAQKFMVLPNLMSAGLIRSMACEYIPDEFDGRPTILSIGRFTEQKGFDLAVKAAAILKKSGADFQWLVIGEGERGKELKKQIAGEELENCFRLIGVRSNPYVYMKNCDIVAQTSRFEGKSVVLDEARILGKPIVATNYPTVRDSITCDREGLIVDLTPEAIAEGISRLLQCAELRKEYSDYLISQNYDNAEDIARYDFVMAGQTPGA